MAEHNQQFDSFQDWVRKASSWLRRRGEDERAICFDAKGRWCPMGREFMRARDEGTFPIRWLWPDQIGLLAVKYPEIIDPEDDRARYEAETRDLSDDRDALASAGIVEGE